MSITEVMWAAATIFFIAFQCIVLRFDISNLENKIINLEVKLNKLTSLIKAESEEK